MNAVTVLPSLKEVRDMLEGLLGREVTVATSTPVETDQPHVVGVYVDDFLQMQAVGVASLAFAAYSGAALGLIPKAGAQGCIQDQELNATLKENFDEVLNVISALFNLPEHPHVRLYRTYAPDDTAPADVIAAARTLGRRLDFEASIFGYGTAIFSLILT